MRGGRAVGGRGVDEGRGSVSDPIGTETGKKGGDVVGVRDRECAVGAVVGKCEAKKRRSDGMSFYMV